MTEEAEAHQLINSLKYGTDDVEQVMLIRYGFPPELLLI